MGSDTALSMGKGTFPDQGAAAPAAGPGAGVELGLRIGRDGTWYHHGSPIRRPALVRLFASVLRRDGAGDHWLVTPVERGRVAVDDAPFVAVELRAEGEGEGRRLDLRTNLDAWVAVGPGHPLTVRSDAAGSPTPYVVLDGGLEARLDRAVYYELVELGVPGGGAHGGRFGVWSRGRFFALGELES
jgi:uncharacterized protein